MQENEFLCLMCQTQIAGSEEKKYALNSRYLKNVAAPCHLNRGFYDLRWILEDVKFFQQLLAIQLEEDVKV